jgi:hypothetical protein
MGGHRIHPMGIHSQEKIDLLPRPLTVLLERAYSRTDGRPHWTSTGENLQLLLAQKL